ncbi:hypothetical protein Tco_1222491 [Tanacetum coccineum]
MEKIQEVPSAKSGPTFDAEPLENIHIDNEYNVFSNDQEHTDQPENMNDTSLMEKVDINTTPHSSDVCNNDFEDDQNADNQEVKPSFANPKYLKKAQSEKPCLYKVPFDKDDLVNIFAPDYVETLILEQESRSKLNIDLVKEYDYSNQNSLYEIFTSQTRKSLDELYVANEILLWLIDEYYEMTCKYMEKIKECECLEIKLSKQKDNLQNDKVLKEQQSNSFRELREKYFEIQDLKPQIQDRNIAISELKKLIEKSKGKHVETKFDKPPVIRQTNAIKFPKPPVLCKPTPFSDSLKKRNFSKPRSVTKTDVNKGLSKLVTPSNLTQTQTRKQFEINNNVIKP